MITNEQKEKLIKLKQDCPLCNGEGVIPLKEDFFTVQICSCSKKISLYYKYYEAGIPEKFIETTPSDFLKEVPDRVKKYTRNIDKWITKGVGLYLWGDNGTGKSFLLAEIAKYVIRKNHSVKFLSLEHFLKLTFENSEELENIREADFIALEEIEKIYKPDKENSYASVIFDDFFRTRSNRRKVTCITSNCELHKLKGIHGKHIASLLKEDLVPVEMNGNDFRDNIAELLGEQLDNEDV
jgi:DNA replication protein DnaC